MTKLHNDKVSESNDKVSSQIDKVSLYNIRHVG